MLGTDIYSAFIDRNGKLHPAGRFLVHDGTIHHLEDYHGFLRQEIPEGVIDDYSLFKLGHPGQGLKVASQAAIRHGHRLDVIPEADLPPMPQRPIQGQAQPQMPQMPSVFHYQRAGHDKPHLLEVRGGQHLLDGNPLEHDEVAAILDNVRTKAAKLRYAKSTASIAPMTKAEGDDPYEHELEESLPSETAGSGEDMDPQTALAHLDQLDLGDEKSVSALKALRRHVFEDPMVGIGNKYAYQEFKKKNAPGVTVVGDANFFKAINDRFGHSTGDAAIKAIGGAWKTAAEHVGEGKAHRFGGDEFHVHFPTYDHAAQFARTLRHHLQLVPPIGGVHKLSMSLGIGNDFDSADKALYQAKMQKAGHTPSTIPPLLVHSLHPEAAGQVPVEPSGLSLTPPSLPRETPSISQGEKPEDTRLRA